MTGDVSGSHVNTATISIVGTDALSGIKNYEVTGTVDASPFTTTTANPLTLTKWGNYVIHTVAVDNAGNKSPAVNSSFSITDTMPPTTTLTGNSAWLSKDTTLGLSAVDAGSGVRHTYYSINNPSVFTLYDPVAGIPVSAEGTTTLRFWSEDNANNSEAAQLVYIHIDKTKPLSAASGVPIGWVNSDTTVTITATDALSGVASIWSSVNSTTPISSVGATRVVGITTEGTHTISFGAVDNAGNREETETATVLIDKTKPVSSTDATASYSGPATVHISATDNMSGVVGTQWKIDGGTFTAGNIAVASTGGTHTLYYYSTDNAGNVENTKQVTFHVTAGVSFSELSAGGTVAYGAHGTVAGKLLSSTPTTGALVTLQSSTNGVTFTSVATATTGADGSFSFSGSLLNKNKTWFQVVFAGNADYAPVTSAMVVYTPKVKVTTPSTKTSLRSTKTLSFTAKVYPSHTSTKKSSTIAFERYKISGGVHVRRVRYYAKITSHSGYSSLSRSFKLPKGTWYVRIYAKADSKHALTYSSAKKLKIK